MAEIASAPVTEPLPRPRDAHPGFSPFNRCNHSPWVIASAEFNHASPVIRLAGVREGNRRLFAVLDKTPDAGRRAEIFNEYMSVKFHLHEWRTYEAAARRSLRNNYLRFLQGWALDSNSVEGAVLKGWVESRIGLAPTFHRGRLRARHSEENLAYAADRVRGAARTSAIDSQLDLVYEFCQYEIRRRFGPEPFVLYRGTFDREDYPVLGRHGKRRHRVLLNSLVSFTRDRERAWEFGSTVWRARVAPAKVFHFAGLLPDSILRGEEEVIVLGGEFDVEELLF
ncbi:MAG: NAD(+)--dinitrogen-reductase ADP-D-ribosyltransferase [Puniceicoccaceae bacterium]